MIGSQAVADEVKLMLGDTYKDATVTVGAATPTLNGVTVLVLIHKTSDKPNAGSYVDIPVLDDQPMDDQVKQALITAGYTVTVQTASEQKAQKDAQKAATAAKPSSPPAGTQTASTH
jgi:hypothetical protein